MRAGHIVFEGWIELSQQWHLIIEFQAEKVANTISGDCFVIYLT